MSRSSLVLVGVVALLGLFGLVTCEKTTTNPPGGSDTDGPATVPGGAVDPGQGDPNAAMPPAGGCLTDADCEGGVCEGMGCGDDQPGTCAPAGRMCTRDSRAYCGCDGQTFRSSGSCPGRRYAAKGECDSPGGGGLSDGSACRTAGECRSGICEGEGCGDDTPGTCVPAKRMCTRDLRVYCGCDGQTFRGSGSCPGQRYASRGECSTPAKGGA